MSNHNTMGNLLLITGKNVKEKISQYFSPDEEDSNEVIFDFQKLIPLTNQADYEEYNERWGVNANSSSTQYYSAKEKNEAQISDELYFNTTSIATKIVERLAQLYPDWEIDYIYADEGAEFSGCYCYRNGKLVEEEKYSYRSIEAIDNFNLIWGREDNFVWCKMLDRYVGEDESASMRILPRVEKDFQEYHREEMKHSKKEIFKNSFKNLFILGMKNYLLESLGNEEWAERLLKYKGNLLLALYSYKSDGVGTSEDREDKEYVCEGWLQEQAKKEMQM